MDNGPLHDDKLFRAINDRLSNYEAPHEGADWDAMSRSLDQLPKAARYTFKWKISLNSILIAVGVLSVSILGFAFSGNKNGKNTNTASANIPVVQVDNNKTTNTNKPAAPVQNVVMNNTTSLDLTSNNASVHDDNSAMVPQKNAVTGSFRRHDQNSDANGLYFGDQIDPKKGFIYRTQENSSLVNSHTDSIPSTYYDLVDRHVKPIHLNVDSTPHHKTKSNSDSTATTTASGSGTPTGDEIHGFDMQLN